MAMPFFELFNKDRITTVKSKSPMVYIAMAPVLLGMCVMVSFHEFTLCL